MIIDRNSDFIKIWKQLWLKKMFYSVNNFFFRKIINKREHVLSKELTNDHPREADHKNLKLFE